MLLRGKLKKNGISPIKEEKELQIEKKKGRALKKKGLYKKKRKRRLRGNLFLEKIENIFKAKKEDLKKSSFKKLEIRRIILQLLLSFLL